MHPAEPFLVARQDAFGWMVNPDPYKSTRPIALVYPNRRRQKNDPSSVKSKGVAYSSLVFVINPFPLLKEKERKKTHIHRIHPAGLFSDFRRNPSIDFKIHHSRSNPISPFFMMQGLWVTSVSNILMIPLPPCVARFLSNFTSRTFPLTVATR